MAPLIPDFVPRHFAQGTVVRYTRSLDQYAPSEGWTYTLYMNGAIKLSKSGVQFDSADFFVELSETDTSSLTPGAYRYAERLTNPGTAFVLMAVESDGAGNAVYSFSSFKNIAPYIGMPVTITGFANGANNVSATITAVSGSATGGTFTVANAGAIDEVHAATAQGASQTYDITGDTLVIIVEPSAAGSAAGAFTTFEESALAAIEAMITARVSGAQVRGDIQAYQIEGRSISKMPLKELYELRGIYASLVWRQQHPGKLGKTIRGQFHTPREGAELPPTWQDVTGVEL